MWLSVSAALATCAPSVMLSAGHGAPGNDGNLGVHGQREADVTLELALDLALRLAPDVRIRQARDRGERPSYEERLLRLQYAPVQAMVELHTDWRDGGSVWADSPWGEVYRNDGSPGFTVLFSEEAPAGSRELARAIARRMVGEGFMPYDGRSYGDKYDADEVPGVFVDRRGLMMLRRPAKPAVIVETHHAIDFEESLAWRTPEVHLRFAEAMRAALSDALCAK